MCGIGGIFRHLSGRPVRAGELAPIAERLRHRGPDDAGSYTDRSCGLTHRRLTILDTSSRGRQPMASADGSIVLVYNGEVYNYVELRDELRALGHRFRTTTDSEVLIELYRAEGERFVGRLNGMFAFALWDRHQRRLLLARDRVGIKPLYLANTAEGIVFASEIRALLAALPTRPQVDVSLLDAYMSVGYVPGERTMLAGIRRLRPGWTLTIDARGQRTAPYWDMPLVEGEDERASDAEWVERIRALLVDAVRLQLRSDVPLGVLLSGGVDSSAVLGLTHSLGYRRLDTFTVGYDLGPRYDETADAGATARRFAARPHRVFVDAEQFRDSIAPVVRHLEEPVTEAAAISLLHVSRLASRHVKVVLSGEGADEVFGGYPIYGYMLALDRYRRLPVWLRRRALDPALAALGPKWRKYVDLSLRPLELRYLGVSFYEQPLKRELLAADSGDGSVAAEIAATYERTRGLPPLRRMMYLDLKTWLPDDLLIKADKMTMAAGLELRVPFLDHRLVELGARLPTRLRLRRGRTKHAFKLALSGLLPQRTLDRRKMGFPTPLAELFRGPLREHVRERLEGDDLPLRECFDLATVRRLVREHMSGERDHHRPLWQLLVLGTWYEEIACPGPCPPALAEAG